MPDDVSTRILTVTANAFAFSVLLYPPNQQLSLRLACHYWRFDGLTVFRKHHKREGWLLPLYRRLYESVCSLAALSNQPHTFWFKPNQHL